MSTTADALWMTQAALDRLQSELAELTAAGAEQDDVTRARVLELREMIRRAEVSSKPDDGVVEAGMLVTVRFDSDASEETFLLGSRELVGAADLEVDVYSPTSPLGVALTGKVVGDSVEYETPSGARIGVNVVAAVPFN
ncbi:GreA/GreB family elongation factor [Microbacterium sp. ZW T5_56]|uniref:GreA/GreB family elongation factor n=1 Tax=Microbacterium sp. ZW T5_56 TaxID=3378081 RepID=UPI0038551D5B